MTMPGNPGLETGAVTDPGRKRAGEPNQDALLVLPPADGRPPLFVIADGMGGHVGGAVASRLVVEMVLQYFQEQGTPLDAGAVLERSLLVAHQALLEHAAKHPELGAMGTTAVLAILEEGKITVANVGDSRAYILRNRELVQLSFDHSLVGEQVRAGLLTPLEGLRSPKRNRLTQSITAKRKEIKPYIQTARFTSSDTLILCTDGLWGVVPEATLIAIASELPPQLAAEKLVQQAVSYGGPDNISVVVVRSKGIKQVESDDDTNPGF